MIENLSIAFQLFATLDNVAFLFVGVVVGDHLERQAATAAHSRIVRVGVHQLNQLLRGAFS